MWWCTYYLHTCTLQCKNTIIILEIFNVAGFQTCAFDPCMLHSHSLWAGIISREDAEGLLETKPVHSYLVRVSEKIWGYAISYKAEDRCKHYLIDTTENGYQFFGTNQLEHPSLLELIQHHRVSFQVSTGRYRSFFHTTSMLHRN